MVCPAGCGRGSARAGSAAVGHSRLLARDTKEEEKAEEDVAVLGLEGGKGGGDEVVEQVARASCWCPVAPPRPPRGRSLVPGPRGSAKGRVSLDPKLLRSFPATPPKSLGGGMIGDIFACHLTAKMIVLSIPSLNF